MRIYTTSDFGHLSEIYGLTTNQDIVLREIARSDHDLSSSELLDQIAGRVSFSTRQQALRVVDTLIQKGLIIKKGAGSRTTYIANFRKLAHDFMSIPFLLRSPVSFDINRIEGYIPNQTFYLSEDARKQLMRLSQSTIQPGQTLNDTIFNQMVLDLSWSSSRLEGNTYTLAETNQLIDQSIRAEHRTDMESTMIENHVRASRFAIDMARGARMEMRISSVDIRAIHQLLSVGLLGNPEDSGSIRNTIVVIGESSYLPEQTPHILSIALDSICEKANAIEDPYEASVFLSLNIAYLQPFIDVNKRTGRIAGNLPLLNKTLCPVSYIGIDEQRYAKAIMSFYETGETDSFETLFVQSYQEAVVRYRESLSQTFKDDTAKIRRTVCKLWVQYHLDHQSVVSSPKQFIGEQLRREGIKPSEALITQIQEDIARLDAVKLIGLGGFLKEHFDQYQAALSMKKKRPRRTLRP